MFGSYCSSFKSIVRADINDVYADFYKITSISHPLLIYDSVEYHIPYHKNSFFSDHVGNIMTYFNREDPRGRPFTKFQQFNISINIIFLSHKNYFIGKAKLYSKLNMIRSIIYHLNWSYRT